FRVIANTAPVIIWMASADRKCTYLNQTWLDLTGQSSDAALGAGWASSLHPDDLGPLRDAFARALERRERFEVEYRLRRHDGEYRWILGTGVPRYEDGSFVGYIGSAIDVTERRRADEALATIDSRLIDAQEEERARIARELHDDIAQQLAALSMTLDGLAQPGAISAAGGRRKIEEAREQAANLAKDVQTLSHRLHPAQLEFLGIERAAKALCRELSTE